MTQQHQTDVFLKHYGVKGMKWGVRKATIKQARRDMGMHENRLSRAEENYVKTRAKGNERKTAKAKDELDATYKAREANRLTALTMTRGEQAASAVLGTAGAVFFPGLGTAWAAGAAAGVALRTAETRDSKKIGDYPIKYLKNVTPEDY